MYKTGRSAFADSCSRTIKLGFHAAPAVLGMPRSVMTCSCGLAKATLPASSRNPAANPLLVVVMPFSLLCALGARIHRPPAPGRAPPLRFLFDVEREPQPDT